MATRLILQIFLFALPFLAFFIYTILSAEFRKRGDKTWPLNALFLSSATLVLLGWFGMVLFGQADDGDCIEPPRIENGVMVKAQRVECERDFSSLGQPLTDDPGKIAQGVGPEGKPKSALRAAREVGETDADEYQSTDAQPE